MAVHIHQVDNLIKLRILDDPAAEVMCIFPSIQSYIAICEYFLNLVSFLMLKSCMWSLRLSTRYLVYKISSSAFG